MLSSGTCLLCDRIAAEDCRAEDYTDYTEAFVNSIPFLQVAEQLLKSNLCEKLLEDSPIDTLDNGRTTCLHLAAKNGHSDIIR